ncbi:RES family NAD+ phosphorylase [Lacibacterium aquatile]|uniref:RES family NAD+ phosphorylase n=1 Tax=Lacibacterium aquatile TaxID=1168082 RepID=A0ABW5DVH1_9PROT
MGISVWRICYNGDLRLQALPYGSTLAPGRWHLPPPFGYSVVYAGSSRALTQLEKRVHANGFQPANQALIRLDLPEGARINAADDLGLERSRWRRDAGYTQHFGTEWLRKGTALGLWVPSIIEPREMNLLINPAHSEYGAIQIAIEDPDFQFDPRLF